MSERDWRWVGPVGVLVVLLLSLLLALYAVLFVPLYWGTHIMPVSVLIAVLANIATPLLARRMIDHPAVAALPVLLWIAVVIFLSKAGPGGDVLIPGSGAVSVVALVAMFAGLTVGVATVYISELRQLNRGQR